MAVVRLVRDGDVDGLLILAAMTGGGMTNLPNDRDALAEKVAWSLRSAAETVIAPRNEFYMLVIEDEPHGHILGTACLYSRLGATWPFYSFKLGRVAHTSRDLARNFSTQMLFLVNDFDGASEVGGLFLHPLARSHGRGRLLARSRYLFIARHRARFGDRVIADLRGHCVAGASPFWTAVGEPFFGSDFQAADLHNALHGNQFIADLMPRYPIYTSMLPQAARDAIGRPHDDSRPAFQLLEQEGFGWDGYVDIFDAGPTLSIRTDHIRAVAHSTLTAEGSLAVPDGDDMLYAYGSGETFRASRGPVRSTDG